MAKEQKQSSWDIIILISLALTILITLIVEIAVLGKPNLTAEEVSQNAMSFAIGLKFLVSLFIVNGAYSAGKRWN